MKIFFFVTAIICMAFKVCFAQLLPKPPLDTTIFKYWPQVSDQPVVSPDGKTVVYFLSNHLSNSQMGKLVINPVNGSRQKTVITDQFRVEFSINSSIIVTSVRGDSLALINLSNDCASYIKGVRQFKVLGNMLYYQLTAFPEKLIALDLMNQKKTEINNLRAIYFQVGAKELFLLEGNREKQFVKLADAQGIKPVPVWEGENAEGFIYDQLSGCWAFYGIKDNEQGQYYWDQKNGLKKLNIHPTDGNKLGFSAMRPFRIYQNGEWIILKDPMAPIRSNLKQANSPLLNIWSFQGRNDNGKSGKKTESGYNTYAVNIHSGHIRLITSGDERIVQLEGNYALIDRSIGGGDWIERAWNKYADVERYLLNLSNGRKQKLPGNEFSLADKGNLLLCKDWEKKTYRVIETATLKTLREIPLPVDLFRAKIFWVDKVRTLFYQDDYDVWKLDIALNMSPVCLTGQYGRKNKVIFSFLENQGNSALTKQHLYLTAQEEITRANGFYLAVLSGAKKPEKLFMGDLSFSAPVKRSVYWIWKRSFADRSPDYVFTKDLKHFIQIPTPKPEAMYNWLRTELHHYQLKDGQTVQGILYKPEDFDERKRYPLILSYYQRLQDWLHIYPEASSTTGPINIPWMVSRGYLVFVPDIVNETNKSMSSATDCILSANNYLKGLSYVDSKKVGITGHSFGGYTTLSVITRTKVFAAAFASAPLSSAMTVFSTHPAAFGQLDISYLPWENKDCYIDNSPLFAVDKVTTPVLIMGNKGDVLWPQPMEYFYGLRRLGKPAWMLEYNGQGHTVSGASEIDLTLRVQQFFDYYLKNKPCPLWMSTPGDSSLDLSPKEPEKGILSKEAEETVRKLTESNNDN